MKRNKDENFIAYCQRLTQALNAKEISYEEWVNGVAGDIDYGDESLRRAARVYSMFLEKLSQESIQGLEAEDIIKEIERQKEDLLKERKRLQTVNAEYQANIRNDARGEMFNEKILEAIKALEPFEYTSFETNNTNSHTSALLCLSDFHAGSTYEIHGVYDEIINKYDFEIMEARLWRLLDDICTDKAQFDNLIIACLGDYFENILRISSLIKLREPVVDTVIKFSEFMATYIAECRKRLMVPIKVLFVGGNHDVCRNLTSKPIDEEENLGKIVQKFVEIRLSDIDGIEIAPYAEVAVEDVQGNNIMFAHGKDSDLEQLLEYFAKLYNKDCDAIYTGHLHSPEAKTIGIGEVGDREVFRCGSICGVDPYAKSIRRAARPSALFTLYSDKGRGWTKNYYLS